MGEPIPGGLPVVVLVQPDIAANVGAVGRLCRAAGAHLAIVRPVPFSMTDKHLRRAGMDYWEGLSFSDHAGWEELVARLGGRRLWMVETGCGRSLYGARFERDDGLVLGSESEGLPGVVREALTDRGLSIPMPGGDAVRSLNLAQAASVALYELLRQSGGWR